ncbi:hypothetical protein HPB50_021784 [Hyalomma asiaticum]|uniref:Uncharacterized protein n=1 Tax=Hyalomma asiaticum TaxID=266040 RepID=A0ACB7SAQ4_HYAAI|nr:hypothetical protein HPB50_021784 [Hyalomma asiaticum]
MPPLRWLSCAVTTCLARPNDPDQHVHAFHSRAELSGKQETPLPALSGYSASSPCMVAAAMASEPGQHCMWRAYTRKEESGPIHRNGLSRRAHPPDPSCQSSHTHA